MIKRAYGSSHIWHSTKKYIAAKRIGLSVNTYSKYVAACKREGFFTINQGGLIVKSLPFIFNQIFGKKRGKYIRIDNTGSFQEIKEKIRAAIILANFKDQDFVITGDRTFESRGKLSKRQSFAKSWVEKNKPGCAPIVNKIITSSRSAGKIITMSHKTANKALFRLFKDGSVNYSMAPKVLFKGSLKSKIAHAELFKPFPLCSYHLEKNYIVYHTGREVYLNLPSLSN